jgi:hypothetical protein
MKLTVFMKLCVFAEYAEFKHCGVAESDTATLPIAKYGE